MSLPPEVERTLLGLLPAALTLTLEALAAIFSGQPDLAARKAREAADRQKTRLEVDAGLRAQREPKK